MEITDKQIAEWKSQHGEINKITAKDKFCIIRKPQIADVSFATMAGKTDPLKFVSAIINNCWLAGDEEIKSDVNYFLTISENITKLIETYESTMEKL